jgi:uncharacterized membrane protein
VVGSSFDGTAAGYGYNAACGPERPFIWTAAGGMESLGVPPLVNMDEGRGYTVTLTPCAGRATGLNDHGTVVGTFTYLIPNYYKGPSRPFLWTRQTGYTILLDTQQQTGSSLPYGPDHRRAHAINNEGQVVGTGQLGAFRWTADGVFQSLGAGASSSGAEAINSLGQVVGDSTGRPVLWDADNRVSFLSLDALRDGLPLDTALSYGGAYALNDAATIVGWADVRTSTSDTLLRRLGWLFKDNGATPLGELPLASSTPVTEPRGINDDEQVVGRSNGHAFLWTKTEGIRDLNSLLDTSGIGWTLVDATSINATGQIVGYGQHNGEDRAFLLTPSASATGTIIVTTNRAAASYNISGVTTSYAGDGKYFAVNAPVGSYEITFAPVPGCTAPSSETAVLTADQTITFDGTYTCLGTLTVTSNVPTSTFSISPPIVDFPTSGPYPRRSAHVLAGEYTITFAPVSEHYTPSPVTVTVDENDVTTAASGLYRRLIFVLFTGWSIKASEIPASGIGKLLSTVTASEILSPGATGNVFTFYERGNGGEVAAPRDDSPHHTAEEWVRSISPPVNTATCTSRSLTACGDIIAVGGHSYGGNRAMLFAQQLGAGGLNVKAVYTIDPIDWRTCRITRVLWAAIADSVVTKGALLRAAKECRQENVVHHLPEGASVGLAFTQTVSPYLHGYHLWLTDQLSLPYLIVNTSGHSTIDNDDVIHRKIRDSLEGVLQ